MKPFERDYTKLLAGPFRKYSIWIFLFIALGCFIIFNYATTDSAIRELTNNATIFGISWGTILAIAFELTDLAGLSKLFTEQKEWKDEPVEVWLLTGAWLIAAIGNAFLTWYAVLGQMIVSDIGNEVATKEQLLSIFPVVVAIFVLLIRISLISFINLHAEGIEKKKGPRPAPQEKSVQRGQYSVGNPPPKQEKKIPVTRLGGLFDREGD